jgi:hypothetical protein
MRRSGVGAFLTLVLLLALGAQADAATTRVVAPGSTRMTTPCTAATPCEFQWAIGASGNGDDVLFTAGEYDYLAASNHPINVSGGVNLHGTPGQPLPLIKQTVGMNNCSCPTLFLNTGDVIRDLAIDQAAANTGTGSSGGALAIPSTGVTIERTVLSGVANGLYFYGGGSTSILRDSVVLARNGSAIEADSSGATNTLENDTVIAHGANGQALWDPADSASTVLNVVNTIARGDQYDAVAESIGGTVATINLHYSDVRTGSHESATGGGTSTIVDTDHPVSGDPVFASATDLRELASSPTVDAGTASGLTGTLDLSGKARTAGPAPDIGAYEFTAAPLVVTGAAAAPTASSVTLPGTVDAQDAASTYSFVYGPTSVYGSSTPPASLPAALGATAVSAMLAGLTPGTYHYALSATNAAGSSMGSDQTFTITAPAPPPGPLPVAPVLSAVTLSKTTFRTAASGPSALAARARVRARPTGTVLSYTDSEAATTTFTITRRVAGARSGRSCVAPSRRLRHARRCTRTLTLGSFTHSDAAGANRLRFSGRLHGHRLAPGRYTLSARARSSAGLLGTPRSVGFRIVR